jgi:phosphoadenosine phosphosulfate reductase
MRGDSPTPSQSYNTAQMRLARLMNRVPSGVGHKVMRAAIEEVFPHRIGVLSSFGAESAVLLHQVAVINPATPVLFLETGKLFAQTLQYQEALTARLGLINVRVHRPGLARVARLDPDGDLWRSDPEACCNLRKVVPLEPALEGFDAWISGRKRYQGGKRTTLPVVEVENRRVKINPLAGWSLDDINEYFVTHDLPRHPLWEFGYLSIGCYPCTRAVQPGEDVRAGRWSGLDKTECGIHGKPWG